MQTELLEKLARNRDELLNACAGLSEAQLTTIPVVGAWTIKDVVGHIAYWEQVIHDHLRESLTEGKPRAMSPDETDDAINARESAKRTTRTWKHIRSEFENTRRALIERVETLSETELACQVPNPWWGMTHFYSLAQMIEEDALSHCHEHAEQIRKWRLEIRD
ncbi:MAG: DinB family protein [Chloroflexi bacterium]|nr:DinB family protein [Chloroflexota bacterium]